MRRLTRPDLVLCRAQNAPAEDSEQLEHRCQIVLAGCDDWRGIVLSLASRLVAARTLQGSAQERAEAERLRELASGGSANATALVDASEGGVGGRTARVAPAVPPLSDSDAPPSPPLSSSAAAVADAPDAATSAAASEATTAGANAASDAAGAAAPSDPVCTEEERPVQAGAEGRLSILAPQAAARALLSDKFTEEERARRFALQTQQVFVPLAHRLGMWYFKTELEQRCFALARPREFAELSARLEEVKTANADTLYDTAATLRQALLDDPVIGEHTEWVRVQARTKAAYSAHTKMRRQGKELDELDDLLGLRVILRPSVTKKLPIGLHRQRQCILCYRVLEVVHSIYPMASRKGGSLQLKDYVTQPKPNGYQVRPATPSPTPCTWGRPSRDQSMTNTLPA